MDLQEKQPVRAAALQPRLAGGGGGEGRLLAGGGAGDRGAGGDGQGADRRLR